MVAFPAIVKTSAGKEKLACKQPHAAAGSIQPFIPPMFHRISSQEELQYEEELEDFVELELPEAGLSPNLHPNPNKIAPALALCQTPVAKKVLYSLSSGPASTCSGNSSSTFSSSRSRQSPPSSTIEKFTSLWENDDEDESGTHELPPIDPSDYMKALLCQLSASISSINTAYAHQQTALNAYNVHAIHGQEGSAGRAVVSTRDKAMVEELQRLSHLHSQLALLPHMLAVKEGAPEVVETRKDSMMQQLKCYEGIITRFHGEMRRKDAVAEALKETLAKSMLKGEKLQQRVKALEAKLSTSRAT